jgi:hypothetical protein
VALGIALIHYSMEVGIKKFQERGKAGVTKELTQMHNMDVFQPVARESLKERAKALALLMFLKEKRDSLWRQGCAPTDGNRREIGWSRTQHRPP